MSILYSMRPDGQFEYHCRHRRKRPLNPGSLPSFDDIVAADTLIDTYYDLKSRAGQAPGPDGLKYPFLGRGEVAAMMRTMSEILKDGNYLAGSSRKVMIPKLNGRLRELTIRGIMDRVVAAAVNNAMAPFWEKIFLPCSYGSRAYQGPWRMLADLERHMIEHDRWVLLIDDIKDAFPSVVIADVLADHRRYLSEPRLLGLIEAILRGRKHHDRSTGIDQGSAYSPTCLNLRLHHVHDLGLGQDPLNPLRCRYVDNLTYPVESVSEGHQVRDQVSRILEPAGFRLKGEDPIADLEKGDKAQLMGFTISYQENRLSFDLGPAAWLKLEHNLMKAHQYANPPAIAKMVVEGWIGYWGPAFENLSEQDQHRQLQMLAHHGFRESYSLQDLWSLWQDSWKAWRAVQLRARQRFLQMQKPCLPAAPQAS